MNAILFISKDIVAIGYTLQQVDGFTAVVPGLLRKLDTTGRRKGRNLVLHIGNAVVYEHRTHREARPVDTVAVNVETRGHLVNRLDDEVLVVGASRVPRVSVTSQVGDDKFRCVYHLVQLVRAILIFRILVHAVSDNHQWRLGGQRIRDEHHHITAFAIDGNIDRLLLVCQHVHQRENNKGKSNS